VIATGKRRVFFSGDTGLTAAFEVIRERAGPFELVMLEVGALHAWDEPIETLVRSAAADVHLVTPRLGRPIVPSRVERPDPWWREVGRAPARRAPAALSRGT
jgi:L-ascorbate metabolism protein UlaG (beta-lactamase superfamily)